MFEVIWHHDMHHDLEDLKKGYDSMNPDSFEDINYNQTNLSSFLEKLDEVMMDGNWLTITDEEIDEAIEEWLLRTFGHDIDFEVDDALAKLEKMNLLSVADDGKLSVVSVENALVTLDDYWDNLYDFVE